MKIACTFYFLIVTCLIGFGQPYLNLHTLENENLNTIPASNEINNNPDYNLLLASTSDGDEDDEDIQDAYKGTTTLTIPYTITYFSIKHTNFYSYEEALEKLNAFLKQMDPELNKWLEIKGGYIIEHFKGFYTAKAKISGLGGVEKSTSINVVHLFCYNRFPGVYSDYMKQNFEYFNYNCKDVTETNTLYDLMCDFFKKLEKSNLDTKVNSTENNISSGSTNDIQKDIDFIKAVGNYYSEKPEKEKNQKSTAPTNTSKSAPSASSPSTNKVGNYEAELKNLNDYFKTFENGEYGYFEIANGYLIDHFKSGKYTKTLMSDVDYPVITLKKREFILPCKNKDKCVYSTNTNLYHSEITISSSVSYDTAQLIALWTNFIKAYNKK